MDLKIGRKYLADLHNGGEPHMVEIVGEVQKWEDAVGNTDRVLVRDLEGRVHDVDPEDDVGGNLTFLWNLVDWTFEEVPLRKLIPEYLEQIVLSVGKDVHEEMWNHEELRHFMQTEAGAFMLTGMMLGKGWTVAEINATLPDSTTILGIIDEIDFT